MKTMSEIGLRHRDKYKNGIAVRNNVVPHDEHKKYEEFITRESPLTLLLENSLHIRAIYHIFVVILLLLFLDTVVYDLIESGKINIGLSVVVHGFGDIKRGVKLWLFDFAVILGFYPALIVYYFMGKLSRRYPGLRPVIKGIGVAGLVAAEVAVIGVPVWELSRKHLAVASSTAVTLEMFRFMMKLVSVGVAVGPRCLSGDIPLPSLKHYLYFMFAPTLLYRDQYPRTKKIRWGYVFFKMFEIAAIVFYLSFLWERFISPYWSDYGKQKTVAAGSVVRGIFACVLPGIIAFFCGFYCLLHVWLNAWSEVLTFGDRLFYEDWWTSSCFSRYFRCWNRVVHSWLRDHIYLPIASRCGRGLAIAIVFMVSSVAHEIALALSFGFFYPVLLIQFGVTGALLIPITANCGKRFPNSLNLLLWMGLFIGNGILWALYPMEYFARKNCPTSENDSYFVPKSWTCPEITFKPDWTFQNPFRI